MKVILGVGFGESYQSSQLRQTNYGMAQWPERSLSEKQPRSGEMFIARTHSHFVFFRNERNARHFAHFGRALHMGAPLL